MSSNVRETEYGSCATWLKRVTLKELCVAGGVQTGPFGSQLHKEDYVHVGTPIVTVEHLGENCFTHQNLPLVSDSDRQRLTKYTLRAGDIVFSRVGSVDRRALVSKEENGWLFSGRCLRVRPNQSRIDSTWLSYFFGQEGFKSHIRSIAVGATMPSLNTSIMENIPIYFPEDVETQKRSASILSFLDKEIHILRHQNTALEATAQTLFRSWFINFEPVHAKAAGNAPDAMSEELASLFPSEFDESERGPAPKGWTAGHLSDVCSLNPESWSTKSHPNVVKYVDLSGLKENVFAEMSEFVFSDAPTRARRSLRKGDSLYGTVRPGNLSYGFVGWSEAGLTGSTGFAHLRPNEVNSTEFVYCAMTLRENIERLTNLAEGAAYPAVRPDIVHEQSLVLPSLEVMQAFHEITSPLFGMHANNSLVISCLAALRDHLLPRLISGKLLIEDAEASVATITSALETEPA